MTNVGVSVTYSLSAIYLEHLARLPVTDEQVSEEGVPRLCLRQFDCGV